MDAFDENNDEKIEISEVGQLCHHFFKFDLHVYSCFSIYTGFYTDIIITIYIFLIQLVIHANVNLFFKTFI